LPLATRGIANEGSYYNFVVVVVVVAAAEESFPCNQEEEDQPGEEGTYVREGPLEAVRRMKPDIGPL
jgi:hypothetical protein